VDKNKKIIKFIKLLAYFGFLLIMYSCNPFAPALNVGVGGNAIITDQTTDDGVFENFRYAYIFKDTVVYGNLLDNNFTFIYRNYNQEGVGVDISWGRDEDMITTSRLFSACQSLDLIWNEKIISIEDTMKVGDSLVWIRDISRGFTLTVVFSPTDIIPVQGRANFRLTRSNPVNPWKILIWRDESNY
jgi:hypothetical protein